MTTGNTPTIMSTEDYFVKILSKLFMRMTVNVFISPREVRLAASLVDQMRLGPKTIARFSGVILFTS